MRHTRDCDSQRENARIATNLDWVSPSFLISVVGVIKGSTKYVQ